MTIAATDARGKTIQALRPGTGQRVAGVTASSTAAAALAATTTVIRVKALQDTYMKIGPSPTATIDGTSVRLDASDGPEYFRVREGDGVAFRNVTSAGDIEIVEMD